MPLGANPQPFLNNAANVWAFETSARVNDIVNPSSQTGDVYMTGRLTYERLYQYMRPYKFKSRWILDMTATGTATGSDFFHVFTIPTISASSPWQLLFGSLLEIRYILSVARKNRLMTYKRIQVNRNTTNSRFVIKGRPVSLKTLLGVNPAFQVNALGSPSDAWSCPVTGTPTGPVYYHLLIVREFTSTSGPVYAVVPSHNYNVKMLYWAPRNPEYDDTSDQTV